MAPALAAFEIVSLAAAAGIGAVETRKAPGWLNQTQTYCMVPLPPEKAKKLNATVNGIWGGIGGTSPLLTPSEMVPAVAARYGEDAAAFAVDNRLANLITCGSVNGLEGFAALRSSTPGLDSMACRDASGRPMKVGDGMMLMCVNNPEWVRWERRRGELAIRQGAESILLDTPMSASFISGFLKGGFCSHCMAGFQHWLEERFSRQERVERFALTDFDPGAVIRRLSPLQNLADPSKRPFHNTSPSDLLFREFIRCQEQSGFDSRKRLIDDLRTYARARNRQVVFSTNAADLGTVNPGGHWVRALMFADLFDLFAYELNPEPIGFTSDEAMPYPRGKWAPYHRLAYAVHGRRSPAVIHAGAMGRLLLGAMKGKSINTWMEVQSAEAYAANGAYIQYHVAPPAAKDVMLERCWKGTARHTAFVRAHRDLYDGELRSGSTLALLMQMNERGRTIPGVYPSYLGFAQALTETGYSFDVVFAGDGHFVRDRLTARSLRPYRTLLVPGPVDLTTNQQRLLRDFVRRGGTVVCQEPERLGLSPARPSGPQGARVKRPPSGSARGTVRVLAGKPTETWTEEVGANFFRSYNPALRQEIAGLAQSLGLKPLIRENLLVSAFPVSQPKAKRLVIHLVNYDIDMQADRIRKRPVNLEIPRPDFLRGQLSVHVLSAGGEAHSLQFEDSGGALKVTLSELGVSATIVIAGT